MVHTVGIVGINGNVGAPTSKALVKLAGEGKIKVVIFHREGASLNGLSKGENVDFRVLSFEDSPEKIAETVKGVNVFISAVGFGALPTEANLVEGLSRSKDLVTFIPSTYSTTWDENDFKDAQLGPVLKFLHGGWDKATEKGVGITPVFTGIFENYWFEIGFLGAPLKENTVWANEKQLQKKVPITMLDHLGNAIAQLASSDPHSIKNKEYSVVTFWPTGKELVDLYTKINGKQAQAKEFSKADFEAQMADGANFGPAKAGYWKRWESGEWGYETDGRTAVGGYEGPGLEEVARSFA